LAVRIFKNAWLDRFARRQQIPDAALRDAVRRAEQGQIDADLGGGVLKQRIARTGKGKSGGYRTIILYRRGERAVFVYGFAKSDRDNIDRDEEPAFRKVAAHVLGLSEPQRAALVDRGHFSEVEGGW
jgi:hypothetical protein